MRNDGLDLDLLEDCVGVIRVAIESHGVSSGLAALLLDRVDWLDVATADLGNGYDILLRVDGGYGISSEASDQVKYFRHLLVAAMTIDGIDLAKCDILRENPLRTLHAV